MGYSKIPSEQKITRMLEQLQSEKQTALQEPRDLQKQEKTFSVVQQNFDMLLKGDVQLQNIQPEIETGRAPQL